MKNDKRKQHKIEKTKEGITVKREELTFGDDEENGI